MEVEILDPPSFLKSSKKFLMETKYIMFPATIFLSIYLSNHKGLELSDCLNLIGIFIIIFAVGSSYWQYFHLENAKSKIIECLEYDVYLNKYKKELLENKIKPLHKGKKLTIIKECKALNASNRKRSEGYSITKAALDKFSFFSFLLGCGLQALSLFV